MIIDISRNFYPYSDIMELATWTGIGKGYSDRRPDAKLIMHMEFRYRQVI